MNERIYDKQSITDYLLGALPAAETERFDELSFTDKDFSNALNAAENDLIDAFLSNELSPAKLEKFKTYYLASPRRREKVEFAEAFQVYAAKTGVQPNAENINSTENLKSHGFFSFLNVFANPVAGGISAALILVLIAFAGFLFFRITLKNDEVTVKQPTPVTAPSELSQNNAPVNTNQTAGAKDEIASPLQKEAPNKTPAAPKAKENVVKSPIIASFILPPPLRSAGNLPNVSFSKRTDVIKITLVLEANDYKKYRVALIDESEKQLWQSGNLKSANKSININFPAKLLKSGIYSLVLSGVSENEAENISTYSFRSVLK